MCCSLFITKHTNFVSSTNREFFVIFVIISNSNNNNNITSSAGTTVDLVVQSTATSTKASFAAKTASVCTTHIQDLVVFNSLSPNTPFKTNATVNLVTPVKKGVPVTDSMKTAANIKLVLKDPPSPVQDDDISFVSTNLPVGKLLSRTDFRKEDTIKALFDAILDKEVYVPESVREEKGKSNTMRWKCIASILKNKLRSKCSDRACQINANKNIVAVQEYLEAGKRERSSLLNSRPTRRLFK